MKKIPEWAPKSLVEHYKKYLEMDKIEFGMLYRLITVPIMNEIWESLYEYRVRSSLDSYNRTLEANENMAIRLFFAASDANRQSQRKIETRAENVKKYTDIAKAARNFSEKVNNSVLDSTPYRYYPLEAINTIIENDLNPEKMNGHYCLSKDIDDFHTKGGIYSEFRAKDLNENDICEHWRVADNTKDWFEHLITPQYPTMSQILTELAKNADLLAKVTSQKAALKPNKLQKSTVFIRSLYGEFWSKEFVGVHRQELAIFCRIALNDESIGDITIDSALDGYKLPKYLFATQ